VNRTQFMRALLVLPLSPIYIMSSRSSHAVEVKAADFVTKAGIAGQFEIESSKLAVEKTKREDIKSFGEHMIKDHTVAAEELKDTTSSKYALPATLDEKHEKMLQDLKAAGDDFDSRYVKMQVDAHKEAVALFQTFSKQGDDAALQAFALKTLPILQIHNDMIEKISNQTET
jgi:putative membrane protein